MRAAFFLFAVRCLALCFFLGLTFFLWCLGLAFFAAGAGAVLGACVASGAGAGASVRA